MRTFEDIKHERLNCSEVGMITDLFLVVKLFNTKMTIALDSDLYKLFGMYYPTFSKILNHFLMSECLQIALIIYSLRYVYYNWLSKEFMTPLIIIGIILFIIFSYLIFIRLTEYHLKKWYLTADDVLRTYFSSTVAVELFVENSNGTISPTFNLNDEYSEEISKKYPHNKSYHRRFLRYMYSVFSHMDDSFDIKPILAITRVEQQLTITRIK